MRAGRASPRGGVRGSEAASEFEARFEQVCGNDPQAAQGENPREHEADGPLPCDHDKVTGQHGEAVDAFEDRVDRFEHCAFDEGILRRDFHDAGQAEGHDAHELRVATAGRVEAGGDTGAFVLRALREGAMSAGVAIHARDVMVQGHAIAEAEAAHSRAEFYDGARGLVAEDARRRDGAVLDFLDVGGADAAHGHAHEQLTRADARHGDGLDAEVVEAAIDHGLHRFWNRRQHGGVLAAGPGNCEWRVANGESYGSHAPRNHRLRFDIQNSPFSISQIFFRPVRRAGFAGDEVGEPRLGVGAELPVARAPSEAEPRGVQRLTRQDEAGALLCGHLAQDEIEVEPLIAAVEFVADEGVAEVLEVDADLVLAPAVGADAQ